MICLEEEAIAVNFFRRLPPRVKVEIDELFLPELSLNTTNALLNNHYIIEDLFRMNREKAEYYTKYAQDCDYFLMLAFWEEISKALVTIFKNTNYYNDFPEYLI